MIPPRGCAFIVMHRRQDANRSMQGLKNHKMHNRVITISWAAGKGVKSKEFKDYWDIDLGVSYIPYEKISRNTDFVALEEGGMFDEDTVPPWMKELLTQKQQAQLKTSDEQVVMMEAVHQAIPSIDTSQPPPMGAPMIPMVAPFPMSQMPRLMPPLGMVPMLNVPPPGMLMGPAGQGLLAGLPPPMINPFTAPPPVEAPPPPSIDDHMDIDDEEKHEMGGFNQPIPPQILGSRRGDFERDDRRNSSDRDRGRGGRENNRNNMRDNGGNGRGRWESRERDSYERDFQRGENNRDNLRNVRGGSGGHERTLQDRLRDLAGVGDGRPNNQQREFSANRDGGRGPQQQNMRDYRNMDEGGDYHRREGGGGFQQQQQNRNFPMRGGQGQFGPTNFMRGNPRQGKLL